MNISEYILKNCKFIKVEEKVPKKKELKIYKKESSESSSKQLKTIKYVNKSIISDMTSNDVILDPAGLNYIQSESMKRAGGASGSIYKKLKKTNFNKEVVDFFSIYNKNKDIYKDNKKLTIASEYELKEVEGSKINIIHAIGPDFTQSKELQQILSDNEKLFSLFLSIYKSVVKNFLKLYKKNNKLRLRILPVSTGVYLQISGKNDKDINRYKKNIFVAILNALNTLLEKYPELKGLAVMYLYEEDDFKIYHKIVKKLEMKII